MKNIPFIAFIFLANLLWAQDSVSLNKVSIQGSSNINHFELNYPKSETINGSVSLTVQNETEYKFIIAVREFDAMNRCFYNNFLTLVKAAEYPLIEVIVPQKYITNLKSKQEVTNLQAKVKLAGINKSTKVSLTSINDLNQATFNGQIALKLSDFNLETPEKLFGIIKVHDEVFINFRLNI